MNTTSISGDISATILTVHKIGEGVDDDRPSLELSETIMQPETVNRNADRGWIDGVPIVHVTRSAIGHIQHHFEGRSNQFSVGQLVQIRLDSEWHRVQMRLICAGRLIQLTGPLVFHGLEPFGADYRLHRAKVEFGAPEYLPAADSVWPGFCSHIERFVSLDLPVRTTAMDGSDFRSVQIGDFRPFRCTAAYPTSLREIGKLSITKIVAVAGGLQVRYRVEDDIVQ